LEPVVTLGNKVSFDFVWLRLTPLRMTTQVGRFEFVFVGAPPVAVDLCR